MDSTLFSNKIKLLCEIYMEYSGEESWEDFFELYDLGVPAAVLVWNGGATLTDIGNNFVDEAWKGLCMRLGIDPNANYEEIEDMNL